ncbi:hypothetical protein CGLO_03756 [Colletotrichum gloeosporioides Cg-14]|uniref:Uncharacterized protein n=1 Tax=Colletotrichum gloeosporioides (strain Cg-14) TaxID=1237896 RepID=T0KKW4_COLGC|nr:hypothetical protein CGLO_03756 [Colletotrichum gloeosporioides Cg-14]
MYVFTIHLPSQPSYHVQSESSMTLNWRKYMPLQPPRRASPMYLHAHIHLPSMVTMEK